MLPCDKQECNCQKNCERYEAGDTEAVSDLIETLKLMVKQAICLVLRHSPEAWDDIEQETYIKMWEEIGTWRGEGKGQFCRWVKRIAINKAIDYGRNKTRKRPESLPPDDSLIAPKSWEQTLLETNDLSPHLKKCIQEVFDKLKPSDQRIVELRAEGMTIEDTAAAVGMKGRNVGYRLARIRKKYLPCLKMLSE